MLVHLVEYRTRCAASSEPRTTAGVQAFAYRSGRDPEAGACVGLFEPAFAEGKPDILSSFACHATRERVELSEKDFFKRETLAFERRLFEVRGALPRPAALPLAPGLRVQRV